ncbi:hypothetical protein, partial [Candidatus Erwinia dacicola]
SSAYQPAAHFDARVPARDAARSAWVIEARGVLDIVADAKAEDKDGVEVKLPVITQLVWKVEEEETKK